MESGQTLTLGLHGSIDSLKSFALFVIISISLIRLFLWTSNTNHFQNDFVIYKVNSSTKSMSYFQQINSSDNHHNSGPEQVCIPFNYQILLLYERPGRGDLISQYPDFEKVFSTHWEPFSMIWYPNIPVSQFQQTHYPNIPILHIDIPISQFQWPISTYFLWYPNILIWSSEKNLDIEFYI